MKRSQTSKPKSQTTVVKSEVTAENEIKRYNKVLSKTAIKGRFTEENYRITRVLKFNGAIICDIGHPNKLSLLRNKFNELVGSE